MTRLDKIQFLVQDIQNTRPGKSKRDKITSLIEYVEQLNEDIKEIRSNLKHPYLNESKVIHTLLEIQIQTRLMQIGKRKRFQEMAVYLFNIRVLIENTLNHLKERRSTTINQE